jgi:hypothetical protein
VPEVDVDRLGELLDPFGELAEVGIVVWGLAQADVPERRGRHEIVDPHDAGSCEPFLDSVP